jgi:hypothetical protein
VQSRYFKGSIQLALQRISNLLEFQKRFVSIVTGISDDFHSHRSEGTYSAKANGGKDKSTTHHYMGK